MAELIPFETILEEELRDPEFRAEWERLAPARALANRLIGYRADRGLTLAALARRLGVSWLEAADLEAGDDLPSPEMLRRVTGVLGASRDWDTKRSPVALNDLRQEGRGRKGQ